MKKSLFLFAALLPLLARSETLDLGTHGTLSLDVPKGWTFSANKMEESGYTLTLAAPADANAQAQITLLYVVSPEAASKERIQDEVLVACDQYVESSVEKKKVLRDFSAPGAFYGCYCVFTDASLVGKPAVHQSYKVVGSGEIRFNDEVTSAVTLLADDEKGPEFAAMLAAISSARVSRK